VGKAHGAGTGTSGRHWAEGLRDIFVDYDGEPIRWPWPHRPPRDAAARRLLQTLGVVDVPMIAAHEMTATHDCVTPLCTDLALRGLDHCRRHAAIADLRHGHQVPAGHEGLAALGRMDAGEPQKPDTTPDISACENAPARMAEPETEDTKVDTQKAARRAPGSWTRETVVADLQRLAETLGHQPSRTQASGGLAAAAAHVFGSWGDAVVAAGFERPTRAFRPEKTVLAEREPKADETPPVRVESPEAERETTVSAATVRDPVSPVPEGADPLSRSANTDEDEPPIGDLLSEFGAALEASEAIGERLIAIGRRLKEHSLYEQVRNWL
jgi:hypothetical protein